MIAATASVPSTAVPTFLVERYQPLTADGLTGIVQRVTEAARQVDAQGTPVAYVSATLVPADETCFLIFDAPSPDTVRRVTALAGFTVDRISEAIHLRAGAVGQKISSRY